MSAEKSTEESAEKKEAARLHAVISGEVQGVNFRHYTVQRARTLGLTGWVANRWDGTVEVTAEGPQEALQELLQFLRRGPSSAFVTGVQTSWEQARGEFPSFRVRYL